jgi:ribosomal protein S18 acetylase RimI-like enzyme
LPNDLDDCAELAEQAWPFLGGSLSHLDEHNWQMAYLRSSRLWSNWAEVACDQFGVVGVLFGRIDTDWNRTKSFWMIINELLVLVGPLNEMPRNPTIAVALTWNFLMTEIKLALRRPRTDAEIEFLAVDIKHRGRGIAKTLVERFFRTASQSGAKVVTVYTDDEKSNWRFYEHMGFERVATFHDNLVSYYDKGDLNGIVYLLRLDRSSNTSQNP